MIHEYCIPEPHIQMISLFQHLQLIVMLQIFVVSLLKSFNPAGSNMISIVVPFLSDRLPVTTSYFQNILILL